MRKVRILMALGATAAGMLAVAPGSASAWPLTDAVQCTNYAGREWDPTNPTSTVEYVTRVEGCWMAYVQSFSWRPRSWGRSFKTDWYGRASTQQFATRLQGCWMTYASFFAAQSHQQEFVLCMDRAVDAYKPPTYVEYMLGITIYCVENYAGYDITISPKLTTGEPPPVSQAAKRQRRAKRRVTRSHRSMRS
jgi:hypothetical protein